MRKGPRGSIQKGLRKDSKGYAPWTILKFVDLTEGFSTILRGIILVFLVARRIQSHHLVLKSLRVIDFPNFGQIAQIQLQIL